MKLLKGLALLVCMQTLTVFAMEEAAIQEIDAEPEARSAAGVSTNAFPSMASLEEAIEEVAETAEPSVPVIIGRVITPNGRVAAIVKDYTKRDILDGLENINTGTGALIELLKTEQPDIVRTMSTLSTIIGSDILTLKPHLLQVIWALYNREPALVVGNEAGSLTDELPRIQELGEEDL
jgi:hypothetical protein